jgi:Reverse transcriptase (RNA-dependent DNA polymerase)
MIAVGCTLHRLVAKVAFSAVRVLFTESLAPLQLGFGVKQGAEAAAHAARWYINNLGPDEAFLKIDFLNAFNAVSRDEVFRSVEEYTPELLPFIDVCYGQPSFLAYGNYVIKSEQGVQQGDPLGPMFYYISLQKLIERLKVEYGQWYWSRRRLAGQQGGGRFVCIPDPEDGSGKDRITRQWETVWANSERWFYHSACPDSRSGHYNCRSSYRCSTWCSGMRTKVSRPCFGKQASGVEAAQWPFEAAPSTRHFFLLRNCLSLPKLQYTMRCSPSFDSSVIARYDECNRDTLEAVLNVQLSEYAWLQASLPVAAGGLGVRTASQIVLPAFLSSIIVSKDLGLKIFSSCLLATAGPHDVHFTAACELWKTRTAAASATIRRQTERLRLAASSGSFSCFAGHCTKPRRLPLRALQRCQHHMTERSCMPSQWQQLTQGWVTILCVLPLQYASVLQSAQIIGVYVERWSTSTAFTDSSAVSSRKAAWHVTMPSMNSSNGHCWQPKFRFVLSRPNCHTLTMNVHMVCQQCRDHVDSVLAWVFTGPGTIAVSLLNKAVNGLG